LEFDKVVMKANKAMQETVASGSALTCAGPMAVVSWSMEEKDP
jgi:hypothetical protein